MQDTPSTTQILLDLVKNGARMGPIVNARMTAAAFFGMPYGIAFAGAQGVIQAVQSGNSEGAASLTADLVDLGYSRLVTWIILNLVDRDRSDVVVEVSVAMMAKGFVSQMTLVTKEIIAQGRLDAGASISGEMLKNGNLEFVKIWNEARKADEGELEKDPRSVKDQLKDAVGSVTGNAKDSDREAAQAKEEGEKPLQDKAKDAASQMSSKVQQAFDNTKVKGQS
ncbi:hypothetical protein ABBQ38_007740 [Trebouxia sp. C0009 RCD-2024]